MTDPINGNELRAAFERELGEMPENEPQPVEGLLIALHELRLRAEAMWILDGRASRTDTTIKAAPDEARLLAALLAEVDHGRNKHGLFASVWEGMAVLRREMEEFCADVTSHKNHNAMEELLQVGAVAISIWLQFSVEAAMIRDGRAVKLGQEQVPNFIRESEGLRERLRRLAEGKSGK